MRYLEGKDASAEILRLVLPLMARQSAAYHPVSYSLWYEHVAGLNPPLSELLSTRLQSNEPLTEEEVYRLHARFISARDAQMLEHLQQQLRQLLEDTAETAALAGEDTGRFRQRLEQGRSELTEAVNLQGMHYVITQLVGDTARMQASARAVSQRLEASAREVTALKEQLQQSRTEALLDPLCGLKNRRGFERAAEEIGGELAHVALLLADIDHFKQLNDTYGHLLGDKVLRSIAQTMQSNIKGRDVAARIGGEEFAILLPETTLSGAQALAEQLRVAVARGRIHTGQGKDVVGSVTLSIGITVGQPGDTLDSLMRRADAGLYSAKRAGRNRVCVA